MNKLLHISILVVFLSFFSCNTEYSKLERIVSGILPLEKVTGLRHVVVIPVKGCSSCGNIAIRFCQANYNNPSIKYIITNYISEKEIKIILGQEVYSHDNIYYDRENRFGKAGFNTMYPLIITLTRNKVESFEYAKPGKDGTIYNSILSNI